MVRSETMADHGDEGFHEPHSARRRFELAWEHSPLGMAMVGLDGEWMDANPALCALLERDRSELRGYVVESVTHPEDLAASLEHMERLLEDERDHYRLRKRYLRSDGSVIPTEVTASLVIGEDGQRSYVLGQVVDLTRQHEAEQRLRRTIADLERSNQALESFAEIASHDLTSPLGTAGGLIDLALRHHAGELSAPVAHLLARANRQLSRALASTRVLLELASAGQPQIVREQLELGALVREVVDGLAGQLLDVDGEVVVTDGFEVVGDPVQLELVFQNLLANAIKFRSPDRPLRVEVHGQPVAGQAGEGQAEQGHDYLAVHIDDNGVGVSAHDAAEMFSFGVQGDAGREAGGLGLGLATCRRIVEHHGGRISAAPNTAGGTRITVELPRAQ